MIQEQIQDMVITEDALRATRKTLQEAKFILHQLRPMYRRKDDIDYHKMIDNVIEKIDKVFNDLPNPQDHSE